jgi:predicted CXXCH cytochrome family protein
VDGSRRTVILTAAALILACAGAALVLAFTAAPADAFNDWAHDGATGCSCHDAGTPTDATCTACHAGFKSYPGRTCWSCHYHGQDTSTLSTPSSACSQGCHLYKPVDKAYTIPYTHSSNPHVGSTAGCLNCHATSPDPFNAGASPHHSGQATPFSDCTACHTGFQKHAGAVACTSCHPTAVAFHLYTANSPGFKNCRTCHAMKHAGRSVPQSACATCHKGKGSGPAKVAQHASGVSKTYVCGTCHKQKLHARGFSAAITSCHSCHGGKYHAAQKFPGRSVCLRCHTAAKRHSNGFGCALCHKTAIHATKPNAR